MHPAGGYQLGQRLIGQRQLHRDLTAGPYFHTMNSVKIVAKFWDRVWKARNAAAIDDLVVDDFVLTTGGVDVASKGKVSRNGFQDGGLRVHDATSWLRSSSW